MKTIKIIFILTLIAHYNSIAQSRKPIKQKPLIAPVIIEENPLTYYTKNYKTQNKLIIKFDDNIIIILIKDNGLDGISCNCKMCWSQGLSKFA